MLGASAKEGWENNQYIVLTCRTIVELLSWDLLAFCFTHPYLHVSALTTEYRLEKNSKIIHSQNIIYIHIYKVAFGIILM